MTELRTWSHLTDAMRAQFWACLALKYTHGLGPRSWTRLLRHFKTAYDAIQHLDQWHALGVHAEVCTRFRNDSWRNDALEEWRAAQLCHTHIICYGDTLYPALLAELHDIPLVLYAVGNTALLHAPTVAVVGSRNCTVEGMRMAENIAAGLACAGICVVSGMALGIDTIAHKTALSHVGSSIGVLGTGIDVIYPRANTALFERMREQGVLLTEFAPQSTPKERHFPIRNRIISGLSLGVVVIEASLRSGSLITARLGLEQGRNVYAVPGAASVAAAHGCQELIRQGATPVFNAEDVLRDLYPLLADIRDKIEQSQQPDSMEQIGALSFATHTNLNVHKNIESKSIHQPVGSQNTAEPPPHSVRKKDKHDVRTSTNKPRKRTGDGGMQQHDGTDCSENHNHTSLDNQKTITTQILQVLDSQQGKHIDRISIESSLDISILAPALLELELLGKVRRLSGALYTLY